MKIRHAGAYPEGHKCGYPEIVDVIDHSILDPGLHRGDVGAASRMDGRGSGLQVSLAHPAYWQDAMSMVRALWHVKIDRTDRNCNKVATLLQCSL